MFRRESTLKVQSERDGQLVVFHPYVKTQIKRQTYLHASRHLRGQRDPPPTFTPGSSRVENPSRLLYRYLCPENCTKTPL